MKWYNNYNFWCLQQVKVMFVSVTDVIETPLDSSGHVQVTLVTKMLELSVR